MSLEQVRQARTVLKDRLHFLPGYPVRQERGAVIWMPAPNVTSAVESQPLPITSHELRRAEHGWKKLQGELAEGLPQAIDDLASWTTGMPIVLKLLKRAVHGGETLPASPLGGEFAFPRRIAARAAALVESSPQLCPLVNALTWSLCLTPGRTDAAIAWITDHRRWLENLITSTQIPDGLHLAPFLYALDAEHIQRHRTRPLLRVLGHPQGFAVPTAAGRDYVRSWLDLLQQARQNALPAEWSFPDRPPALATELLELVRWLASQPDKKLRERALRLVELLFPDDLLPTWQRWWSEADPWAADVRSAISNALKLDDPKPQKEITRRRRFAAQHVQHGSPVNCVDILEARGSDLERTAPAATADGEQGRDVVNTIKELTSFTFGRYYRRAAPSLSDGEKRRISMHVCETLQRIENVGGDILPRLRALHRLAILLNDNYCRDVAHLLDTLLTHPTHPLLWLTHCDQHECESLSSEILRSDTDLKRGFAALRYWTEQLHQATHRNWPLALSRAVLHDAQLERYLHTLAQNRQRLKPDLLDVDEYVKAAVQIADDGPRFLQLLESFNHDQGRHGGVDRLAPALHQVCTAAGWPTMVADLILDRQLAVLDDLHDLLRLTRVLGDDVAPPEYPSNVARPDWIEDYAPELHADIAILSGLTPRAQTIVREAWRKAGPDAESLTEQVQEIWQKLAEHPHDVRLVRGLANKLQQLEQPAVLRARRIETMQRKLQRLIRDQVLTEWSHALRDSIRRRLGQVFEGRQIPAEWLRSDGRATTRKVLFGIFQLTGRVRDLAIRILTLRLSRSEPPWNLQDEEANRRFVEKLEKLHINLTPWMHPETRQLDGPGGKPLTVSLEQDPLEIFYMGGYFDTCLSPGAVNFFSTVAIAADVNKQVLFARDRHGRVVGRCLLALTRNGGLLTFRPYCYASEEEFAKVVSQFANDLARQMRTTVYERGDVDCLVATKWYDDGPHDLCGQLPCLRERSALRQQIPHIALSEWIPLLERELAPLTVNDLTLPLVLALPELKSRPELIAPLKRAILSATFLSYDTVVQAATLAMQAGEDELALQLIRTRVLHRRRWYWYYWVDQRVIQMLTKLNPTLALRKLRKSRDRGVRSDQQETDADRRNLLASCHEALGRHAAAARLRRETGC